MKKTLLLVFIHGFKGGDDTFGKFPAHLRALLSHALPKIDIVAVTYPAFETRGGLGDCVARFREWLQNKVIDIEVANQTASPTVDPSVHVVLVGHSMGGIIAAETLILLASEQLIPPPPHISSSKLEHDLRQELGTNFMFPHIQGVLAFDTPFLGIAPGVVSYAAEQHHKAVAATYEALSATVFSWKSDKKRDDGGPRENVGPKPLALPSTEVTSPSSDAAAIPSWQRWGRYAMFAGAAGAVAAGGSAALYTQRDRFTAGWSWVTSHLEFVGCLGGREELRNRVAALAQIGRERGVGCANFYTCLGDGAISMSSSARSGMNATAEAMSFGRLRSDVRTFCSLPEDVDQDLYSGPKTGLGPDDPINQYQEAGTATSAGLEWIKATNSQAVDETKAHMSMFLPASNPEFYDISQTARDLLVNWLDKGWYETSGDADRTGASEDQNSKGFMDDYVVVVS